MNKPKLDKVENFFSQYSKLRYKRGEIILRPTDNPSGVFYLINGYVRLFSVFNHGQELTYNIFKPGTYFSMMWAIGNAPNAYFFEALTPVEVWRASKDNLIEFLKREPEVFFDMTHRVLIGLDGVINLMGSLLFNSAYEKVVTALLICARRFGEKRSDAEIIIRVPLTHKIIASLAGLTRETTSIEMKRLENEGILRRWKKLQIIKDVARLEKILFLPKDLNYPYAF